MPAERRGQAIAFEIGSTGNGRNPMFNGRRQPSCGGTSRMTRECQVRFCERLGVQFPGPTRQNENPASWALCQLSPTADMQLRGPMFENCREHKLRRNQCAAIVPGVT